MKRLLIVLSIIAVLLPMAACGSGDTGDTAAIKETIKGYFNTYNAEDFAKCLTYFTDYDDEEEARATLAFFRSLSGKLDLKEVRDISITGQTATATVVFKILGEQGEDQLHLKKVQGQWKIIWDQDQEPLTGEPAAIRDALVGYLAAYNAEDFAKCLTYLTGFGDEQEARGSLALIREYHGPMTFKSISSINITGDTASAYVDYVLWWKQCSDITVFRKEADAWKVVWSCAPETGFGNPAPATVQRVIPGTVEIAPDLSDLLEVKHCVLEGDDGVRAWLWEAFQVRNTGDQQLHLAITVNYYDEDGAWWMEGTFGSDPVPGGADGTCFGSTSYGVGYGPSTYKLIIEEEG